jgi:hypothetical protein
MCGGPVCLGDSDNAIGCIEGIIDEDHEIKELRGMTSHIETDLIKR